MDDRQWTIWLETHGPALVLAARQWVGDHAAAEDLVQDAFLRFWPRRGRVDDPLAWLYVCAKRLAIQGYREAHRRTRREGAAAKPVADDSLFVKLHNDERRALIEAALVQLPEAQREVLIMKIWVGLSFPQIGRALDIPADTAASRYRYALQKLRESLAQEAMS
jgi:RNA polymerase sigma-70 factor (ECF subfamily)